MKTLSIRTALAFCLLGLACALPAQAQDAAALRAKHEAFRDRLANNPFKQPLVLESVQSSGDLKGEVYAVVDQPFGVVGPALQSTEQWCELLMLHLNVKGCSTSGKPPSETLSLVVGRKFDQPLDDGYPIQFAYAAPATGADYLRVQMSAESGPLGTRNYRLALEAVPLDDQHSFLHMSYAYAYGTAARLAMQAYLSTSGRDKIGFSITGKGDDGKPVYVDGVRAVLERNTMRYYLAIETYLGSLAAPAGERTEKRLHDWFAATERHAPQLHEMERDDYLAMKRRELQRQRGGAAR
ncbi:MAG TPA: hypothetical protein VNU71_06905 [Burkholderiaceae bacterium]|nr:hypothetical protein [Burkholderiaceae bacterium]